MSDLGWIYSGLGKKERAREHQELALQLFIELGDSRGEAWARERLSFVYDDLGDKEQARMYSEQALDLFKKGKEPRGEA